MNLEIDTLVSEQIMGESISTSEGHPVKWVNVPELGQIDLPIPSYSSDMEAAWKVWEVLAKSNKYKDINLSHPKEEGYKVSLVNAEDCDTCKEIVASHPRPELAICCAALAGAGICSAVLEHLCKDLYLEIY